MSEPSENGPAIPSAQPLLSIDTRKLSLAALLCATFLGFVWGGVHFLLRALRHPAFLDDRLYDLFLAFGLLALPASIAWKIILTRLSTGRWTKSPEQRRQAAAQCAAKRSRVTTPSAWTWTIYCLKWANVTARQPQTPSGPKFAARALLLLGLLGFLATCLLPLIGVGAAFADDNTHFQMLLFFLLACVFALLPWTLARSLLRYKRTHPFMQTHPVELEQFRAQHKQWRVQESRKPLQTKIITAIVALAVPLFWWLRATVFHAHHRNDSWVTAALYTPFALYAALMQFRKSSSSQPEDTQQAQPDSQSP